MRSTESDERYEVILKHDQKGVLRMGSFKTLEQARKFLFDRWAELPERGETLQVDYGAAIFDKQDSRKRILALGAHHLTDEDRRES
jgi:hypothetical protein